MRSSPIPKQFDNSFTHQKVQVTGGCPWWTVDNLLIIRAGNLLVYLQIEHRLLLPLVEIQLRQDFVCQPVPPEGLDEHTPFLAKPWLGQTCLAQKGNHVERTGASLFDVAG